MNSMFSSFDAVMGELLGVSWMAKSSSSSSSSIANHATETKSGITCSYSNSNSSSHSRDNKSNNKKGSSSSTTGEARNYCKRGNKGTRFAPELDGLFSFETLVRN